MDKQNFFFLILIILSLFWTPFLYPILYIYSQPQECTYIMQIYNISDNTEMSFITLYFMFIDVLL